MRKRLLYSVFVLMLLTGGAPACGGGGGNGPDNDQVEQALRIAFFADQIEVECPDEAGNTPVGESFECDVTLADEDGQNETSFSVDAVKTDADTVHYQYEPNEGIMVEGDVTLTDDGDPP